MKPFCWAQAAVSSSSCIGVQVTLGALHEQALQTAGVGARSRKPA